MKRASNIVVPILFILLIVSMIWSAATGEWLALVAGFAILLAAFTIAPSKWAHDQWAHFVIWVERDNKH